MVSQIDTISRYRVLISVCDSGKNKPNDYFMKSLGDIFKCLKDTLSFM